MSTKSEGSSSRGGERAIVSFLRDGRVRVLSCPPMSKKAYSSFRRLVSSICHMHRRTGLRLDFRIGDRLSVTAEGGKARLRSDGADVEWPVVSPGTLPRVEDEDDQDESGRRILWG